MIKFFRKIRQNLIAEGKTANYLKYAIGEIILVVIGILIALQINTWNQERINSREEQRIFQDLSEELEYNRFLLQYGSNTMLEVAAAAERMLSGSNDTDGTFSEEAFNQDLDKLTWVWVSGRPTTLYDVLSASGDINIISSPVLRKKLADLKRNQESLIKFEEIQNRFVDEQLRPFLNQNVDRTKVRSLLIGAERVPVVQNSVFPPNTRELLQNREFANLLTDLIFFTKRIEVNYKRIDMDIAQIDSLVHTKYPDLDSKKYNPY
jgi:hypothetical protein